MDKKNIEASEVFMETVSLKLDQQDQKIEHQGKKLVAVENSLNEPPSWLFEIKQDIQSLRKELVNRQVPVDTVQDLSNRLTAALTIARQPLRSEVAHHHHVSAGLWVAIVMLLLLCLSSSAWYLTTQKLAQYQGNDIQFRYLKLAADLDRSSYLHRLDSLYRQDPDSFQQVVVEQERALEEHIRLLERMDTLDRKIKDWRASNPSAKRTN